MAILNWKASFDSGDLSDKETLKQALAYKCYSSSSDAVKEAVDRLTTDLDCDEILAKFHNPLSEEYCLGKPVEFSSEKAFHLIDKAKIFPNPSSTVQVTPKALLQRLLSQNSEYDKKVLFISDWNNRDGISQVDNPETVDCKYILQALGIFGRKWLKGQELAILSIQPASVFKSTWVDGRLNLVWYSNSQDSEWGITRSLDTGLPLLKEWVIKNEKDQYQIKTYYIRDIDQDLHLDEANFSQGYWDGCKSEIEEAR